MLKGKKKLIISILGVLGTIILVASLTYAYFLFSTNSETVGNASGKLDIDYDISETTVEGVLIPSATRSGGISDTATAKLNTGSVPAAINFYITLTELEGMPAEALNWEVDVLNTLGTTLNHYSGDFSDAVIDTPVKIVDAYDLSSSLLTFNIYIWLNGELVDNDNFDSDNSLTAVISADTVPLTGRFIPEPNPITDYVYEIGTDDAEGYVILKEYIGTSSTVIIPDTYTIDNVTYNTALYIYYDISNMENSSSTFSNNDVIVNVSMPSNYYAYILNRYNSEYDGISNSYMINLFRNCTSLVNISNIPDTVTNMLYAFSGCTSLVNAPEIPNGMINMQFAFNGCTSLVSAPTIPNTVTSLGYAFAGCTSLVSASTIGNSVTEMSRAFYGCTSLTGTIRINSSDVSLTAAGTVASMRPFYGTVNPIIVEVPENSTTYSNFTASGKPANVTVTTFTP